MTIQAFFLPFIVIVFMDSISADGQVIFQHCKKILINFHQEYLELSTSSSPSLMPPALGSKCSFHKDCGEFEVCIKNSCECAQGYVEYIEQCFPIRKYGEECNHDIQCNNDRMICTNDENDVQQKMFCYCDPYHLWNSTTKSCLEINISQMAGNFREAYNVTGLLEKSAQKVFLGVVIAGLISVSVLLSFIGICSVYGCCENHKKGRYVEEDAGNSQVNEVAIMGLPDDFEMDTDFSAIAV